MNQHFIYIYTFYDVQVFFIVCIWFINL